MMLREVKQIADFFRRIQADSRLTPVHHSLCMALCCCWQSNNCQMPFRVTRKQLMKSARILSTATYHKCIREMSAFGYISYQPDYNYYKGTQVKLFM